MQKYVGVGSLRINIKDNALNVPGGLWRRALEGWTTITQPQLHSGALSHDHPAYEKLKRLNRTGWVQVTARVNMSHTDWGTVRVYVLPSDTDRRQIIREEKVLRQCLPHIMQLLDYSSDGWYACFDPNNLPAGLPSISVEEESLFYIFNTLKQPSPSIKKVKEQYAHAAMIELLDNSKSIDGLLTSLWPYQRRSAAAMLQRETRPSLAPDPRYEKLTEAWGNKIYYYDRESGKLVKDQIMYEDIRGGILAETMGYGKTLICLALIMATRGFFPRIPDQLCGSKITKRPVTASLMQMAAHKAGRASLPWRGFFEAHSRQGNDYEACVAACKNNAGSYQIKPLKPKHSARRVREEPEGELITLCPATIIIVPQNLVQQWLDEIEKHTEGLKVLVLRGKHDLVPKAEELLEYDIILFSRQRFEKESLDGSFLDEQLKSKKTACLCVNPKACKCGINGPYQTPLKELHFLRMIVDEGHDISSSRITNTTALLEKMHIERRWVVSGTPANSFIGVEVGRAANETTLDPDTTCSAGKSSAKITEKTLAARRTGDPLEQELKDLEKLGYMIKDYLQVQPFAAANAEDRANWNKSLLPTDEHGNRKKAQCLRNTLQRLVIRHPIDVVEADLRLPPLHNKIVYLEPSFYDKMSINNFILVLTSNAVTSERTDQDYMFHPKNRRLLENLITNLRHSGFWWAGFTEQDIRSALQHNEDYLEKQEKAANGADLALLKEAIAVGKKTLASDSWKAFSTFHEIGIYVESFPKRAVQDWALHHTQTRPLLLGSSLAKQAQEFIAAHIDKPDPVKGLAKAGIHAIVSAKERMEEQAFAMKPKTNKEPQDSGKSDAKAKVAKDRADKFVASSKIKSKSGNADQDVLELSAATSQSPKAKKGKRRHSITADLAKIPDDSKLNQTKIIGTAGAKLSYLLDQVVKYQDSEKIIIFYEDENIAYWLAEGLELLGAKFLIYAKTLTAAQKTSYLATFDRSERFRVLLMDLGQASHGLHIASASRVFIVNPIWQPNVEAQAIKRAHRMGQKKPVYVETLVLRNTLEDRMLQRRKAMTNQELQQAEKSLLQDTTMSDIIKNEGFIRSASDESTGYEQMARLETPQPFFARRGYGVDYSGNADDDIIMAEEATKQPTKKSSKRKAAEVSDLPCLESDAPGPHKKARTSRSASVATVQSGGLLFTSPTKASSKRKATAPPEESSPGSKKRKMVTLKLPSSPTRLAGPSRSPNTDPSVPVGTSLGTGAPDVSTTPYISPYANLTSSHPSPERVTSTSPPDSQLSDTSPISTNDTTPPERTPSPSPNTNSIKPIKSLFGGGKAG